MVVSEISIEDVKDYFFSGLYYFIDCKYTTFAPYKA